MKPQDGLTKKYEKLQFIQAQLERKIFEEALQTPADSGSKKYILKYLESRKGVTSLSEDEQRLLVLLRRERQKSPSQDQEALKKEIISAIVNVRTLQDKLTFAWDEILPAIIQYSSLLREFYEGTSMIPPVSLTKTTSNGSLNSDTTDVSSYSMPSSNASDGTRRLYQGSESDDERSYSQIWCMDK